MKTPSKTIPTFTEAEREQHVELSDAIAATAAKYLEVTLRDHRSFFAEHGVSKYYGDRRTDYATLAKRKAELRKLGKSESLAEQQVPVACIVLAKRALQQGFIETGTEELWLRIDGHLRANGHLGTDLLMILSALGWRTC